MSDESRSAYAHVPILTKDNYQQWALKVKAFLGTNDHVRVIRRMIVGLVEVDPIAPDPADASYEKWVKSEQVALSLIITDRSDRHQSCNVDIMSPSL